MIETLRKEVLATCKEPKNETEQVIQKMTKLTFEHALTYQELKEAFPEAALIISRTFFERITSLLFILKDEDEVAVRAQLFDDSSRIRELLRVHSILGDNYQEGIIPAIDRRYHHQQQLCAQVYQTSLEQWIANQIDFYKERFDKVAINYVSEDQLKRDHRRKGWCYIDQKVHPDFDRSISNFSDLVRYTYGDESSFLYHYFYGLGSLYTHGYDINPKWMMGFEPNPDLTEQLINELLLLLAKELFKYQNKPANPNWLHQEAQVLETLQHLKTNPCCKLPQLYLADEMLTSLEQQLDKLMAAYHFLKKHSRFQEVRILVRTIFSQASNYGFMTSDDSKSLSRIYRYQLSSRIQYLSNLRLLLSYPLPVYYQHLKEEFTQQYGDVLEEVTAAIQREKEQYDAIALGSVSLKELKYDSRRRQWFMESMIEPKIKNSQQVAEEGISQDPLFCWRYEDGFHSVYMHGINLDHRYHMAGEELIFTHDVSDLRLCDALIAINVESVKADKHK